MPKSAEPTRARPEKKPRTGRGKALRERPPLYRPPAPEPASEAYVLSRLLLTTRRDLLTHLPRELYGYGVARFPTGFRDVFFVSHPEAVRRVMVENLDNYPKSDLFTSALDPLVGESLFTSSGASWKRQRRMSKDASEHLRLVNAFPHMVSAVEDYCARAEAVMNGGTIADLEADMAHVTADIIFRTIFSRPIESTEATTVFEAFRVFQNAVPQVTPAAILKMPAFARHKPNRDVLDACATIRGMIDRLVDERARPGAAVRNDICQIMMAARDAETGEGFTREEVVNQLAVMLLAGHETSASALTWAFFVLSQAPDAARRIRAEVEALVEDRVFTAEVVNRLVFTRNVFREILRLYPPVSFITRVAEADDELRGKPVSRGSLVVVSPWLIHRHRKFWKNADRFDPDRWSPKRATKHRPGAYVPFGLGPRVCNGASFAMTEGTLILAAIASRFAFEPLKPEAVEPACRLTVRPADRIPVRIRPAASIEEAGAIAV